MRKTSGSSKALKGEAGFSLIELLVAISVLAIISVSVVQSATLALRFQKHTELGNLATNLAVTQMEILAGANPDDLPGSSYVGTESNLTVPGHTITFTRDTSVTTNADDSLTITVTVSSNSSNLLAPVTYTTRFAPWES